MQDWSTPLVLATVAFLVLVVWRVRPALPWGNKATNKREALKSARARIEAAPDEPSRALALCDADDIMRRGVAGAIGAKGLYQRALRADPQSVDVVRRAADGLSSRPRALESLMWRHLAATPWTGTSAAAARASLETLRTLYEGPLRNSVRARALGNASLLVK